MHIDFVRTGGFAGLRLATSVETTEMPPDQATILQKLFDDSAFFELPEKLMSDKPMPDRFQYHLAVASEQKTHTVDVGDSAVPESLRPLLNYLTTLAMVRKDR